MQAVLVRVGIDRSEESGDWNAPVNPAWEFAYVPILENEGKDNHDIKRKPIRDCDGCKITYQQFKKPCENVGRELKSELLKEGKFAHLDPDFRYLTYGDIDEEDGKNHRGKPLLDLQEDDLLVFYAALDPGRWMDPKLDLVYAIIGLFVIKEKPRRATEIPDIDKYLDRNAHTRRYHDKTDIIVSAKGDGKSGRLTKCIPIGKRRAKGKQYRVTEELLRKWGDLPSVNDGWIQRSGRLPDIGNPAAFYEWFLEELDKWDIQPVQKNNLD